MQMVLLNSLKHKGAGMEPVISKWNIIDGT
jgi:hypothetical protein